MVNIAFAGGGTGGHVFPIKSLIEYIKHDKNLDTVFNNIYWFGENNSLEERISNSLNISNLKFIPIVSGKIRREKSIRGLVKNFIDVFNFILGFIQSFYLLIVNKVDIIFCKGGYVAGPVVFAGWLLRKKIYLHESDTVPGLANIFASKFSKLVFTGFPGVFKNEVVVGQILSQELLNSSELVLSLDMSKTNVLVMGGSQGSRTMYENLISILNEEALDSFNFIIVLGTQNFGLKDQFLKFSNVNCFEFITQSQMGYLCTVCDVGITRGGATSLAEQKLFGLKLIIVPLPYTGGNHQFFNGKYYKEKFNDILILQDENLKLNLSKSINSLKGFKKDNFNSGDLNLPKQTIFQSIL